MILGHRIIGSEELCHVFAGEEGCSRLARDRHRRDRYRDSLNSRLELRNRDEGSNRLSRNRL